MSEPFTERLVRTFLPDSLARADENTRRRARLVVLFSFTIFLCGPGYGAVYLLLGMPISAIGAGVAAVVLFATPFVQRRTGSVALGAHLVSFGCYAALALVTAPTGGLAAPALTWLALIPVTALMLGGKRAGQIWTAISLASVVAYFALDTAGYTPPSEAPQAWLPALRLVVACGLVGLIALLAWLYESNKDLMLDKVEAARHEAEAAHRDARLVLDNVAQGLLMADRDGKLVGESSRFASELFGQPAGARKIWELFADSDRTFSEQLALAWEALFEEVLPLEVTLAQLPKLSRFGDRTLGFEYAPVRLGSGVDQLLVVISDVTPQIEALEVERRNREQLDVFRWIVQDGAYFVAAFDELRDLVRGVEADGKPWLERLRLLHTLKGNAGTLGLSSLARSCHELEEQIRERLQTSLAGEQRAQLLAAFSAASELVEPLLRHFQGDLVSVQRREYRELLADVARRDEALHRRLLRWSWEPTRTNLERLAQQAKALAQRLGRGPLEIAIEDTGTRVPAGAFGAFWSSAVHVIRNAVDHGIESPEERVDAGKPGTAHLTLRAREEAATLVVEVEDDGRGIDWERVRHRALELGLPANSPRDLELALFADGLSTSREVTEVSGRGVGLAAVLASCREFGGDVEVRSEPGAGTCLRFRLPCAEQLSAA